MKELLTIWFTLVLPTGEPVHWQENFWSKEDCTERYLKLLDGNKPTIGGVTLGFSFTPCVKR